MTQGDSLWGNHEDQTRKLPSRASEILQTLNHTRHLSTVLEF